MTEQQGAPRVHARDRDEGLRGTETKAAFKTTEFIIYIVAVAAVLIASFVVQEASFGADHAWRYVTYLMIGYMISRGLAKSGSRNPRAEGE